MGKPRNRRPKPEVTQAVPGRAGGHATRPPAMTPAEVQQLQEEILYRLLPTYAPTPERFAALHMARDAISVLIDASCSLAFAEDEKSPPWAAGAANVAWAALTGRKLELTVRTRLIERVEGEAARVEGDGPDSLQARAENAATCFRLEWPEYGRALSGADFVEAIGRWRSAAASPRVGKWPSIVALLRKAGLPPPSIPSLISEHSRRLRERKRRHVALNSRIKDSAATA